MLIDISASGVTKACVLLIFRLEMKVVTYLLYIILITILKLNILRSRKRFVEIELAMK